MKKVVHIISIIVVSLVSTPLLRAEIEHAFLWEQGSGMQDLGTLGGPSSIATAINDAGVVAGYSDTADGRSHAFLWTVGGGMQDIGVPDGGFGSSAARAINSNNGVSAQVVKGNRVYAAYWTATTGFIVLTPAGADGYGMNDFAELTGGTTWQGKLQGYIWDPLRGRIRSLGFLPGGDWSYGIDINNSGNVAGEATMIPGFFHPIFWSESTGMLDLGVPPNVDFGTSTAINERNQVVGETWLSTTGGSGVGFYWSQSTGRVELASLPGAIFTFVTGINNQGMIIGDCQTPDRAVLWDNYLSTPRNLGFLPGGGTSVAMGINNHKQVVGFSTVSQ